MGWSWHPRLLHPRRELHRVEWSSHRSGSRQLVAGFPKESFSRPEQSEPQLLDPWHPEVAAEQQQSDRSRTAGREHSPASSAREHLHQQPERLLPELEVVLALPVAAEEQVPRMVRAEQVLQLAVRELQQVLLVPWR